MSARAVIFYDGICGLCDRSVRFVVARDRAARFRFAPLQSAYAKAALARHGRDAAELDTVYALFDPGQPGERLLAKSDAALAVLQALGGIWRGAMLLRAVPRAWRDAMYDWVARHRYRWFGRFDHCPLPPPELRQRFVAAALVDE
ncbi:MAG: thiol-disulfide oxidoreductase DCC family protein [Candidatus Binatia bacterium]